VYLFDLTRLRVFERVHLLPESTSVLLGSCHVACSLVIYKRIVTPAASDVSLWLTSNAPDSIM